MILHYRPADSRSFARSLALRYLETTLALDRAAPIPGGHHGPAERHRYVVASRECVRAARLLRPMIGAAGGTLAIDCYLGITRFRLEEDKSIAVTIVSHSQSAMFAAKGNDTRDGLEVMP